VNLDHVVAGVGGVVWISGYSATGKAAVARHVERLLRERKIAVVRLDVDDLRNIFSRRERTTP
jgi:adenylylsulfate kinase-like enzyme